MNVSVSSGELPIGVAPRSRNLLIMLGSRSVSAIALESLAANVGGVFGGATIANQVVTEYPGKCSEIAGRSGKSVLRFSLSTARPRSLPVLSRGRTLNVLLNTM